MDEHQIIGHPQQPKRPDNEIEERDSLIIPSLEKEPLEMYSPSYSLGSTFDKEED